MSRTFFASLTDALWGFLPKELQGFQAQTGPHNLKVWYRSAHEHYEVQRISKAVLKASGEPAGAPALEIGFHAEHPKPPDNDAVLDHLTAKERTWRRSLGKEPEAGAFLGRRDIADRWRRVSELWTDIDLDEDGAAIEAAERLGSYIRAIEPLMAREPGSRCACWRA
jgi:hypothetical protein